MFDKRYKFHQWWYAERDHNHNGICEYGSTDGTLIAACWESGMDNGCLLYTSLCCLWAHWHRTFS